MSIIGQDEADMEFAEYDEGESDELWDDTETEDYDAAESRSSDRARRARQQRIAQARRRQALARARSRSAPARIQPSGPTRATPQQAVSAIRTLDLETKVQEDTFRRSISTQSKRMSRSEYAAVAGAAANQFIESFNAPDNPYAQAALRFAPLLLLSPQGKGTGMEGFIKDPRVIGGAAVLGITFIGENRKRSTGAREINILSASELQQGEQDKFIADVLDGRGAVLDSPVEWESDDRDVVEIDNKGRVIARKPGTVIITAKADGVVRRVRLKVRPGAGGTETARPEADVQETIKPDGGQENG